MQPLGDRTQAGGGCLMELRSQRWSLGMLEQLDIEKRSSIKESHGVGNPKSIVHENSPQIIGRYGTVHA